VGNINFYANNIATSRTQDMLGEIGKSRDIVVKNVMVKSFGALDKDGKTYIGSEFVEGTALSDMDHQKIEELRKNGEFRRQEAWIQINHVITGQVDGHGENIKVKQTNGGGDIEIKAFDNDLAFPPSDQQKSLAVSRIPYTGGITWTDPKGNAMPSILGTNASTPKDELDDVLIKKFVPPPIMDEGQFTVITNINLAEYDSMLADCGIGPDEREATRNRVGALIAHAYQLKREGRIIKPTEWGTSQLIEEVCTPMNFYPFAHGKTIKYLQQKKFQQDTENIQASAKAEVPDEAGKIAEEVEVRNPIKDLTEPSERQDSKLIYDINDD
jgi:hypothetical protein